MPKTFQRNRFHLKFKYHSTSSGIECFKCKFEAENLADFKMHAKQHINNDKEVQHKKCNVCSKMLETRSNYVGNCSGTN